MADLLGGITARTVETDRLNVRVLEVAGRTGTPVVFVHGNVSSSLFWQRAMLDLPGEFRPLAVDLRGFGGTDPEPVDATRGVRDYSDDVAATMAALALGSAHLVGWSLGGGVVLQLLRDRPELARTVTLVNPVSPYGFGGTRGTEGELVDGSGAGSGAGGANPDFVRLLGEGDRTADSPLSPRQVLLSCYVKPPLRPELEDTFVESMLSTRVGEAHYPGDTVPADAWPGVAPGRSGVLNALAPTHFRLDDLPTVTPKPPILWLRGADDQIVSDTSLFDLAYLGSIGAVPGWPGEDSHPPQPMIAQTRAVLERYAAAGGRYDEVVFPDTGHSPHIERPAEFAAALRDFLGKE
ncbi:pimeloyl-ACP methyl ester carboxylesterase [Prauserella shujinwangii]|uniref:Pimeloyl-ACP methyl ester carboxylesterase n=1 Tax=Prauserella shujinwangii TaxID=1453103 RepID=A0A2T0LSL3_9PSEU|nr:alpha/beta hydrolase [Prauserella shujinwangii]PRX46605.1 pimeloyl-ACP methyl ester carboxylesterase [Prauserella shujinwangii]